MANLLQTLTPILLLLAAANTARSQLPSSTSFFYDFHRQHRTGLTFQGDAHFPPNSNILRLTNARNNLIGRVLYTHPIQFWQSCNQVDFSTTLNFTINGRADGIVFFIAPVGSPQPPFAGGGHLGLFDSSGRGNGVFAVEFDPFINGWDPNHRHVGINLGTLRSSNTTNVGDAILGREVTARISYVGSTRMIMVVVEAGSQRFEVSLVHDLSGFLTQQVQVGLAASTGQQVATHDIASWYFTATMNAGRGGGPAAAAKIRQVV